MRNDDRELRQRLHHARAASQPIHFGVTKTIGEYVVAPPLSRFIRRHPDAAMTMKIANTEELIRGLEEGDIQFALVEGYFDPEEFEALRYDTVAFVPVTSARHEFQKTPKNSRTSLQSASSSANREAGPDAFGKPARPHGSADQ